MEFPGWLREVLDAKGFRGYLGLFIGFRVQGVSGFRALFAFQHPTTTASM